MSTPTYSAPLAATVDGVGPYAIPHPYGAGEIAVVILAGAVRSVLAAADYQVTPAASITGGNLVLTAPAALAHAGATLLVLRATAARQEWLPVSGPREGALAVQLDLLTRAVQDHDRRLAGALRSDRALTAFVPVADRALVFDANGQPVPGPTTAAIIAAEANSALVAQQTAAAVEAATQALAALAGVTAAAALLGNWRGVWATGAVYGIGDRATNAGSTYRATVAHTAGAVFATDLGAGRWEIFAAKGTPGEGTGDMLAVNNLSEVNPAVARGNLQTLRDQINGGAVFGRPVADGNGPAFMLTVRGGIEAARVTDPGGSQTRFLQGRSLPQASWAEGDIVLQAIPSPRDIRQAITDWALARLPGYGQERQNLTAQRTPAGVYQNDTQRPIEINILARSTAGLAYLEQSANGSTGWVRVAGFVNYFYAASATIPPGQFYRLTANAAIDLWTELRSTAGSELLVEYDGGDVPLAIEVL